MKNETLLSIVGAGLIIVGSINAFFLKGIYSELGEVKIQMAVTITNSLSREKRILQLEEWKKEVDARFLLIERRQNGLRN